MIDLVTSGDIDRLAHSSAEYCVSVYLPTHRTGPDQDQDPIRLDNLLVRATEELTALGLRAPSANTLLAPASDLLKDKDFWAHLDVGLAVLVSPDGVEIFRLADPVEELVVVADRFHIKPLISAVASGTTFDVLALSQNHVRLLRGNGTHLAEIGLGDIPPSLAEVVRFDDREAQLHSHGADRTGIGRVTATFHGHGGAKDTADDELRRFLRAIDDGLTHLIGPTPPPLVLAGVDRVVAAYRNLSSHPNLVDAAVGGNPEQLNTVELHRQAWPVIQPIHDRARLEAAETFLGGARPRATSLSEVLQAASAGRVDALFTPIGKHRWGTVDSDGQSVGEHDDRRPGDYDLYDLAAVQTVSHHGTVYAVASGDVPGEGPLAAILRY